MKILLLAPQPFFQNRGTPIAVRMLTEELQADGHTVDLLVFHEGEEVDLGGAVLHRIAALPGISNIQPGFSVKKIVCDILLLAKAVWLCTQKRYQAIHAVEEAVFIAMILKLIFRVPYVYDIDSWLSDQLVEKYPVLIKLRRFFRFFEKAAVRYSDGIVAVCRALEIKVKKINPEIPLLRLEDVSLLSDTTVSFESLRDRVGNDDEIVLYVGNLESYQGIELLLQAFAILHKRKVRCNLIIIGGSAEYVKTYSRRAEELAIASRVFFIGPRPLADLAMYLKQADLLVSPRAKGVNTPMKIYSYMDSGVPLAATRIESHTQVLDDTTALLADADPESFARTMETGIREKSHSAKLATAAQERVEKEYSRAAFRKKITSFYKELSNVWNMRI